MTHASLLFLVLLTLFVILIVVCAFLRLRADAAATRRDRIEVRLNPMFKRKP